MVEKTYFQQLGTGVASLTFGVALSIFIYAAATGLVNSLQSLLLFLTSFLLMLRFWWRYSELFVRSLPSRNYWHFLFDFAVSFFGIIAVLLINNIQLWAAAGAAAMLSSAIRCALSWKEATKDVKKSLKRTLSGAVGMLIIMAAIYFFSPLVSAVTLSEAVFVLVLVFIVYASRNS